jgi:hypothetical protein
MQIWQLDSVFQMWLVQPIGRKGSYREGGGGGGVVKDESFFSQDMK